MCYFFNINTFNVLIKFLNRKDAKNMKCIACGTEVPNGQANCPYCGTALTQQQQSVPYQPAQQNSQPQQNYYGAQPTAPQQGQPAQNPYAQQPYVPQGQPAANPYAPQQQYGQPVGQPNPYAQQGQPMQGQYNAQGQTSPYVQGSYAAPQQQANPALVAFSHVPGLFWLGLIDGSPRAKKASTQGLWLLFASIGGSIVFSILSIILALIEIGFIGSLLSWGWSIAISVFAIIGIVKGFQGEDFEVPVVGKVKIFDK